MTRLYKVTLRVPLEVVDQTLALFEKHHLKAISWFECPDAPMSDQIDDNGFPVAAFFLIDGYSLHVIDIHKMEEELQCMSLLFDIDQPQLEQNIVEDADWVSLVNALQKPIAVGRFFIYTQACEIPKDLIGLDIQAATAFGSGDHPTTRGCLQALSDLSRHLTPHTVLDMGCGSGVLAIAARKLWEDAVIMGADNDENAVDVALYNAANNEVEIEAYTSFGFEQSILHRAYDVILSNILAKPLCEMAVDMARYTAQGGYVILSGLLERQAPEVLAAYHSQGFQTAHVLNIDGWNTLVLKKID